MIILPININEHIKIEKKLNKKSREIVFLSRLEFLKNIFNYEVL